MKYVIMQSGFGDYWVGKTKLELPGEAKVFDDYEDAQDEAASLCMQCDNRDEVESVDEDDLEEVTDKEMLKWLAT